MRPDRPLRLTRRGKAVLWGLCLLLMAAVCWSVLVAGLAVPATQAATQRAQVAGFDAVTGVTAGQPAPPGAVPRPGERVVVVRPGDTLWSIAAEHAPSRDPYGIIEKIRRRNDLSDHVIHAGQELIVP